MAETWLTPEEVEQLTEKVRWGAQRRALARMGVPFLPSDIGRPLVERATVLKATPRAKGRAEPNWNAIRNGKAA